MNNLIDIVKNLTEVFNELTQIANSKLQAAKDNRLSVIDDCMTKEQAIILRLKGLEVKREAAMEELGFAGLSFREILEKVEPKDKEEYALVFEELSRAIQMFQLINDEVIVMLDVSVRDWEKKINESKKKGTRIYSDNNKPGTDTKA